MDLGKKLVMMTHSLHVPENFTPDMSFLLPANFKYVVTSGNVKNYAYSGVARFDDIDTSFSWITQLDPRENYGLFLSKIFYNGEHHLNIMSLGPDIQKLNIIQFSQMNALEKALGEAKYCDDFNLPHRLITKLVKPFYLAHSE